MLDYLTRFQNCLFIFAWLHNGITSILPLHYEKPNPFPLRTSNSCFCTVPIRFRNLQNQTQLQCNKIFSKKQNTNRRRFLFSTFGYILIMVGFFLLFGVFLVLVFWVFFIFYFLGLSDNSKCLIHIYFHSDFFHLQDFKLIFYTLNTQRQSNPLKIGITSISQKWKWRHKIKVFPNNSNNANQNNLRIKFSLSEHLIVVMCTKSVRKKDE